MLFTAHVRWLQTGPMYDGNVGVARFPDFSPMSKLEIWFAGYCLARRAAAPLNRAASPELPNAPSAGATSIDKSMDFLQRVQFTSGEPCLNRRDLIRRNH